MNLVRARLHRPWRLAAELSALLVAAVLSPSPAFFRRVFGQQDFGRYFVNSLVVAGGVVIASALIAFLRRPP